MKRTIREKKFLTTEKKLYKLNYIKLETTQFQIVVETVNTLNNQNAGYSLKKDPSQRKMINLG